jgi:4-amino-4-deoxy-L-arabinose transferase-like glycosyltransferase
LSLAPGRVSFSSGRALSRRLRVSFGSYALLYLLLSSFLLAAHAPLLNLPYYWDEAGQFVPAALDIFQRGAWIPHSAIPNVHPPGLMAYLAAVWTLFGYSIPASRIAMLLLAAAAAAVAFLLSIELSRGSTGAPAFTAIALLVVSPLFFSQSMLAQLDMPATCFTCLALLLFLQNRFRASAITCAVLVMVKETGIVAPALFGCWLLAERRVKIAFWYLLPLPCLAIWLVALHHATGYWFGNSEFTRYNLVETLNPARFLLALARRVYYLFISSGHIIGTVALIYAFRRTPLLRDRPWRIAASLVAAQILMVSLLGGAVLERYLLPVLPIVYAAFALSTRSLTRNGRLAVLIGMLACLVAALFIDPPYPFPLENNLAFVSFVSLERDAAASAELEDGVIATAFPVSNALRRPELGFVGRPLRVREMADFRREDVMQLRENMPAAVIVFDPVHDPFGLFNVGWIRELMTRYYDYQPRMTPDEIAEALSMKVGQQWNSRGFTMSLVTR